MKDVDAVPFEIAVPDAALDDLRDRLRRTRYADDFGNDGWSFGVPGEYLRTIVDYWRDEFDWRAQEAAMNRYAQFRVVLDDVPIHFVHERGRGPTPMPLLLTHGWPWTFWDYEQVIGPLADPAAFGGDPRDAFDVVVPSLPGTAFSSPLRTTGIGITSTADLWLRLMRDVLGYDRFAAGGGDSGAFISTWLGHAYGPNLIGVHLTFPAAVSMAALGSIRPDDYSPDELQELGGASPQDRGTTAHMAVHIEDPQTLAWAMNDSPAGLAAWLIERRRNWSDCGGDVESRFTKDQLADHGGAVLVDGHVPHLGPVLRRVVSRRVVTPARPPTARRGARPQWRCSPAELLRVPRRFMERQVNLARWTVMPRGGHFAPSEEPDLLVEDIRAFFRDLR